jgi:hypothetical protein
MSAAEIRKNKGGVKMLLRLRSKKGQAFSEYAIFVGIILAALMAMQHYLKASMAGKLKAGADYMRTDGGQNLLGETTLYDPMAAKTMDSTSELTGGYHAAQKEGGVSDTFEAEKQTQKGSQTWKIGDEEEAK